MRRVSLPFSLRALPLAAVALASALVAPMPGVRAASPATEIRALWVLRSSLVSPASVAAVVSSARTYGFNALLVQVRGRGDAYYASQLEPRAEELSSQPGSFDPLQELLTVAHQGGLQVHAWVNVSLVSSASDMPGSPSHLVYEHPDWLMVPRPLAREMAGVDPASPAYLGRLSRWTRAQGGEVEGLYASPLNAAAAEHLTSVVADLAGRYALDGLHLDYIRYPDDRFDYSRSALAAFRSAVGPEIGDAERRRLDALAEDDPLAYPDNLPEPWTRFRRAQLSALVMRLRTAAKAQRPNALVSAAVAPDVDEAFSHRLQDWRTWLESGLIDAVCPMAYTQETPTFARQIASARGLAGTRAVWAGIGAYRLTPAQTVQHVQIARQQGADGFVLFSYDSLNGGDRARDLYLSQVSRALFPVAGGSRE